MEEKRERFVGSALHAPHRSRNERRVLSLIRHRGGVPKANLARLTGLSPTAVSSIIRQLETDGLLMRGEPQRGRVGQPSVPYFLDPDGAASLGLKIGRRSAELVLLDAAMTVRSVREAIYDLPLPATINAFVEREILNVLGDHPPSRLAGFGIAMPSEIWAWSEEINVPENTLDVWRSFDLAGAFDSAAPAPVSIFNDATAACAAQLARSDGGPGADATSFVYFFVGWFVGGGVVLNGRVVPGKRGNAGSLGSMPVCARDGDGPKQLIKLASLHCLENELAAVGVAPEALWAADFDWSTVEKPVDAWIAKASDAVAHAIAAAAAVIDFDAAVIDGTFPASVRRRFVSEVEKCYEHIDRQGLADLSIREGSIGRNARAIGAACLPLLSAYGADGSELLDPVTGSVATPVGNEDTSRQ